MQPLHITIVGGGFCGLMTAINLMRSVSCPIRISIINKGNPFGRGVAYSPASPSLLLNVRTGNMGAFPDDKEHFLRWLKKQDDYQEQAGDELANSFAPRELFGDYLVSLWRQAMAHKSSNCTVNIYDDRACKIIFGEGQYYIYLEENAVLRADVLVLATGNSLPRVPSGISPQLTVFHANPWAKTSVANTKHDNDILIAGNGLTMADVVVSLLENGFIGKIHTVSPHGLNLKPCNEEMPAYTGVDPAEMLAGGFDLAYLVRQVNQHRKAAEKLKQSIYPMIDSLRPYLQQIWLLFSTDEKRRFLRWLRPLWDSARHRLPMQTHKLLQQLIAEGRLVCYRGSIQNVHEQANGNLSATLNCQGQARQLAVQRIINCAGPECNILSSSNKLLSNMAADGMIRADELNLGLVVNPADGRAIAADGTIHKNLFVVGSALKGALWEITSVPDLRVQVKQVADIISKKAGQYCVGLTPAPVEW